MLRDSLIAAIRTGVAGAVALAITWLIGLGIEVPGGFAEGLIVVVFGVVVAAYNLIVSFLERKVHPLFGVLLGVPKAPNYAPVVDGVPQLTSLVDLAEVEAFYTAGGVTLAGPASEAPTGTVLS